MPKAKICEANGVEFSDAVSTALRSEALARNEFYCHMCGLEQGEIDSATGRRAGLNVDYLIDKDRGGKDEPSNLSATCSICIEGLKGIVTEKPTRIWLLSQVRRAPLDDQIAVFEWLRKRFNI